MPTVSKRTFLALLSTGALPVVLSSACMDDVPLPSEEDHSDPDVVIPLVTVEASTPMVEAGVDAGPPPPPVPCHVGMHPRACQILASVGFDATITQTLQTTSASGVTHLQDGTDPVPYTVGADFRTIDRDAAGKRAELEQIRNAGFVAWIRIPGKDGWASTSPEHIHSMFPGATMKADKVYQIKDYLANKDGLANHQPYTYATPTKAQKLAVIRLFNSANTPPLDEALAGP